MSCLLMVGGVSCLKVVGHHDDRNKFFVLHSHICMPVNLGGFNSRVKVESLKMLVIRIV